MTPQYILRKSLCRVPHCAGPYEFRGINPKYWPKGALEAYLRTAESYIENLDWTKEYADNQGYTQPTRGILFSDWNYFSREATDLLEKYGYEIEWEDEWTTCDGCRKALRTSPDCYQWQPAYIQNDKTGECYCFECLTEEDIESLENNPTRAVNLHGVDLNRYGYHELKCGYESGWHPGQNDDPKKIYKEFKAHGHKRLLFQIDSVGQFDVSFCIWEKNE